MNVKKTATVCIINSVTELVTKNTLEREAKSLYYDTGVLVQTFLDQ